MTKKDYELIARTVNETYWALDTSDDAHRGIEVITSALTESLAKANPKFDRAKFRAAALSFDPRGASNAT